VVWGDVANIQYAQVCEKRCVIESRRKKRILLEPHVVEGSTKHDSAEDEHAGLAHSLLDFRWDRVGWLRARLVYRILVVIGKM
jgi:hypothetical protein